jgi:hypothetical protein
MIKKILVFSLILVGIFFLSFTSHENYLLEREIILPFSLQKVYLFHLCFSLLICINFQLLSSVDKIFSQLGFIYLGTLFFKIVLFCAFFYQSIFSVESLSLIESMALLIPMFIFLLTEAFFVARILIKKD